jgi:hypothetical protein
MATIFDLSLLLEAFRQIRERVPEIEEIGLRVGHVVLGEE